MGWWRQLGALKVWNVLSLKYLISSEILLLKMDHQTQSGSFIINVLISKTEGALKKLFLLTKKHRTLNICHLRGIPPIFLIFFEHKTQSKQLNWKWINEITSCYCMFWMVLLALRVLCCDVPNPVSTGFCHILPGEYLWSCIFLRH